MTYIVRTAIFKLLVLTIFILSNFPSTTLSGQSMRISVKFGEGYGWGYLNEKGDTIVSGKHSYCGDYTNSGTAIVCSGTSYSPCWLVDSLGKTIRLEKGFNPLRTSFIQKPIGFLDGMLIVEENFKYGAINTSGELVFPCKYKEITNFSDGYALASVNRDFFVLSKYGNVKPLSDDYKYIEIRRFSEGLAPIEVRGKGFGYIDTLGNMVIAPEFLTVGYFSGGAAWARSKSGKIGFIDKTGEWIIKPKFVAAREFDVISGLAFVRVYDEWAYTDREGNMYEFPNTDKHYRFCEGLAIGRKDNKLGYINNKGEWVIKPIFDVAKDFENGHARVEVNGSWGLIDKQGNWVLEPIYEDIGKVSYIGK